MASESVSWKAAPANEAGQSLNRLSDKSLKHLLDSMTGDNIAGNDKAVCWTIGLKASEGSRARKFLPANMFAAELAFWEEQSLQFREHDADRGSPAHILALNNVKFWTELIARTGPTKRVNFGVLSYHVMLWSKQGRPPAGTTASHLCGNAECVNPAHLVWEGMQLNATRNYCTYMAKNNEAFSLEVHCLHEPKCVV